MAKLPNRLVIEKTSTDKVNEFGYPVIDFESKDYAECVIEELEKIKANLEELANDEWNIQVGASKGLECAIDVIEDYISELKGEQNDMG